MTRSTEGEVASEIGQAGSNAGEAASKIGEAANNAGEADRGQRQHRVARALYLNAALLAAIAVAMLLSDLAAPGEPAAGAQALPEAVPPIAGGAGLFMMPAQLSRERWGVYLMDIDTQTLVSYEYAGEAGSGLRLTAARNFRFDRRLGNFNTVPPPREVERMLDKEQASDRVIRSRPLTPTSPETPARTD
jgi:hypothetical protein